MDIYDLLCVCWSSDQYTTSRQGYLSQDIHWCQISDNRLICQILVLQLTWNKDDPYSLSDPPIVQLIGKKMVLFKKKYIGLRNLYCPMYDDKQCIIGTQWLPEVNEPKGLFVQLPHIKEMEWQFKTDLASSGYRQIFHRAKLSKPFIEIIEAQLS